MITQEYLKECLFYDPITGVFTWLSRPRSHFKRDSSYRSWNTKYSGLEARSKRSGYICISINKRLHMAHRLAWLYVHGRMPNDQIDHINGIRHDNRIVNLRQVTHAENRLNAATKKDNTSGVSGVHWDKSRSKWMARINKDGVTINLGRFESFEEAVKVRRSAEKSYGYHQNHGRESHGYQ